jgi:hypothetical protein
LLTYPTEALSILPLRDDSVDRLGIDPRSPYVEEFWLGILGPSTTWLARRLASTFDDHPEGFELPLSETARALGLGDRGGRHSPFLRAVNRLLMFDLAHAVGPDRLAVRRFVAPLNHRQLARLGPEREALHQAWLATFVDPPAGSTGEEEQRRSRHLALSLVELGEQRDATERQLLRWQYPPAVACDAARWAWERHRTGPAADRRAGDPAPAAAGSPRP